MRRRNRKVACTLMVICLAVVAFHHLYLKDPLPSFQSERSPEAITPLLPRAVHVDQKGAQTGPAALQVSAPSKEQAADVFRNTQSVPDLTRVYAERRQRSDDVCFRATGGLVYRVVEHNATNAAFCITPKVGCTHWLSVFRWLHNDTLGKRYTVPFDMPRYQVHYTPHHMKFYRFSQDSWPPAFLGDRFRFMFVREPYARLWSAYVDKFLLPDYWNVDGLRITGRRKNVSEVARRCGHDVTFPEFVDYITSVEPSKLNDHYRPYQYICSPCVFRPHLIGKMETFQQDSSYILQQMNLTGLDSQLRTSEQRALHEMPMLIDDAFHEVLSYKFFENCTNSTHVAGRLWQALQISGYIPNSILFPWTHRDKVAHIHFKALVRTTYLNRSPKNPALWRAQKEQAMVDAYSELSDSAMEKLRKVFATDFAMFGYDPFLEILYRKRPKG